MLLCALVTVFKIKKFRDMKLFSAGRGQPGQDVSQRRDGRGQGVNQHVPGPRNRRRQGLHVTGKFV